MQQPELAQYLGVLILLVLAAATTGGMLVLSVLLGKRGARTPLKDTPYECGMEPVGHGMIRFGIKFYRVAMLFLLFDVAVVFLYPWAVAYKEMLPISGAALLWAMLAFIGILTVGYLYALKQKAFTWHY
ncbi:MAG: NADH-quinone oxidoreductase subunit A [Verrucomicrobiae bacterium]|nr:NADH-quinone oxidoreductase subunit A [Verrucomicrobiae bacterium]MDW7980422.1 NADH-quinone oxidoreductase subunit A [Verrucomicrobiales bacterium]